MKEDLCLQVCIFLCKRRGCGDDFSYYEGGFGVWRRALYLQ